MGLHLSFKDSQGLSCSDTDSKFIRLPKCKNREESWCIPYPERWCASWAVLEDRRDRVAVMQNLQTSITTSFAKKAFLREWNLLQQQKQGLYPEWDVQQGHMNLMDRGSTTFGCTVYWTYFKFIHNYETQYIFSVIHFINYTK